MAGEDQVLMRCGLSLAAGVPNWTQARATRPVILRRRGRGEGGGCRLGGGGDGGGGSGGGGGGGGGCGGDRWHKNLTAPIEGNLLLGDS